MPNWNSPDFVELKQIIVKYAYVLQEKDVEPLKTIFSKQVIVYKGEDFKLNKTDAISWYNSVFGSFTFLLKDATAAVFSKNQAQILLWFEVNDKPHIESLLLIKDEDKWQIEKVFGLGYEPETHAKIFRYA